MLQQVLMKLKKEDVESILENAFAYIVVFAMFAYGVGKIIQFDGAIKIDETISELTGMQLMWAFYGYSKPFVVTLGLLEISGGVLLLFKRTRILGCLLVTSILVNVILQDIFYGVHLGALRAAIIYQLLIIIILWFNRQRLVQCFKILTSFPVFTGSRKIFFIRTILSVLLFVLLRVLEFYITNRW